MQLKETYILFKSSNAKLYISKCARKCLSNLKIHVWVNAECKTFIFRLKM